MSDRRDIVEHVHPSRRDYADEVAIDWWKDRPRYERKLGRSLLLSQDEGIKLRSMWPTCDVCDKPVREMETVTSLDDRYVVMTARCHGEEETMRIGMETILELVGSGVTGGRAFVRLRIAEQGKIG